MFAFGNIQLTLSPMDIRRTDRVMVNSMQSNTDGTENLAREQRLRKWLLPEETKQKKEHTIGSRKESLSTN